MNEWHRLDRPWLTSSMNVWWLTSSMNVWCMIHYSLVQVINSFYKFPLWKSQNDLASDLRTNGPYKYMLGLTCGGGGAAWECLRVFFHERPCFCAHLSNPLEYESWVREWGSVRNSDGRHAALSCLGRQDYYGVNPLLSWKPQLASINQSQLTGSHPLWDNREGQHQGTGWNLLTNMLYLAGVIVL